MLYLINIKFAMAFYLIDFKLYDELLIDVSIIKSLDGLKRFLKY